MGRKTLTPVLSAMIVLVAATKVFTLVGEDVYDLLQ